MNDTPINSPTPSSPAEEPENNLLARGWESVTDAAETAAGFVAEKTADAQEFLADKVSDAREFIDEKIHPDKDEAGPAATATTEQASVPKPRPPASA